MQAQWTVERTRHPRFPFRIRIEQDGRTILAVRAQHPWPGAGAQIFCLRETEFDPAEPLEPFEEAPVAHVARLGRRLAVTLDRPSKKRCEFLKVERTFAGKPGTHEQIFFRTEAGNRAHRTRGRVELVPLHAIDVVVDLRERVPWRFPAARVVRRRLSVGDYALEREDRLVAVVERKSFENFRADVGQVKALHQQLSELATYPHAAFVVECQYADLSDPKRCLPWPLPHLPRVAAELTVLHANVPIVFAGNRKLANVWTQRFFAAVAAALGQPRADVVRESLSLFEPAPSDGGLDTRIRLAALRELPSEFSFVELRRRVPDVPDARLRRILGQLRAEGRVSCRGRGVSARWTRVERTDATSEGSPSPVERP